MENFATTLAFNLPFLFAAYICTIDFFYNSTDVHYFDRAARVARKRISSQYQIDLTTWKFDCFREAINKKCQSEFLALLLLQALGATLCSYYKNKCFPELLTLGTFIVPLSLLLVASITLPNPMSWYYAKNKDVGSWPWVRALVGRASLLAFFVYVTNNNKINIYPNVTSTEFVDLALVVLPVVVTIAFIVTFLSRE